MQKTGQKLSALSKITPYIDDGYNKEESFTKCFFYVSIQILPFSVDVSYLGVVGYRSFCQDT